MKTVRKQKFKPTDIVKLLKDSLDDMQNVAKDLDESGKIRLSKWSRMRRSSMKSLRQNLKAAHLSAYQSESEKWKLHRKAINDSLVARQARLQAEAKEKPSIVRKQENSFVVSGRVVDEKTGVGLANVMVSAFDMDRKYDDLLGRTVTDKDGYYQMEYTAADLKDIIDRPPDTYIEALDVEGRTLYTSPKSFTPKLGKHVIFDVPLDGDKLAASLATGKDIQARREVDLHGITARSMTLQARISIANSEPARVQTDKARKTGKSTQGVLPKGKEKAISKQELASISKSAAENAKTSSKIKNKVEKANSRTAKKSAITRPKHKSTTGATTAKPKSKLNMNVSTKKSKAVTKKKVTKARQGRKSTTHKKT